MGAPAAAVEDLSYTPAVKLRSCHCLSVVVAAPVKIIDGPLRWGAGGFWMVWSEMH